MNFFLTPKHRSDKPSKDLSTKILNFMTNGAGVLVLQSAHTPVSLAAIT